MRQVIICDIDGTLSNIEHRRHLIESTPKNWNLFFEKMSDDSVNVWCAELIDSMFCAGIPTILITARHEKYRQITTNWLLRHKIVHPPAMFMRPDDNPYGKDADVKKLIYETKIKDNYSVLFVLDDRQQVVDMWRSLGLTCLQCAKGDY